MSRSITPERRGAMSVDAFAQWAGVGRTTAWNEIRLGRLRAIKVGARTLIAFDDAQAWLCSLPEAQRANHRKKSNVTAISLIAQKSPESGRPMNWRDETMTLLKLNGVKNAE
jgi:hypothetical protein